MNTLVSVISLSRSFLHGTLPNSLGKLMSLQTLDLSYNHISGSIPSSLGNISTLRHLNVSSNALQGTIPDTFQNLIHISDILLATNQLSGSLPSWLGALNSTLKILDLRANLFEGKIIYDLCALNDTLVNLDSNVLLTCYEGCFD